MALKYFQIPILNDNYIYVLRNDVEKLTYVVDPGLAEPVVNFLKKHQFNLDGILNTHHHYDHTDGNLALKNIYDCEIYGYQNDATRIPGITQKLVDNQTIQLGSSQAKVIFTPGHTLGHICYYFESENYLFCGDTLFNLGCGRLFEGTHQQMLNSLNRIAELPDETLFFCAHEYTMDNLHFARSIQPNNDALKKQKQIISELRSTNTPTVPADLKTQKQLNPFLQSYNTSFQKDLSQDVMTPLETFTKTRTLKDQF